MSTKTRAFVEEFHTTYRAAISKKPNLNTGFEELRLNLIVEEVLETLKAIMLNDNIEYIDGLGDMDYVIEGAAITFGLTLDVADEDIAAYAKKSVPELIGSLVLATNALCRILKDPGYISKTYHSYVVRKELELLKTLVWAIAHPDVSDIPLEKVIEAIHESNMSKLGEDGNPIFREDGKVLKGPNFFTPTARIAEIIEKHEQERIERLNA